MVYDNIHKPGVTLNICHLIMVGGISTVALGYFLYYYLKPESTDTYVSPADVLAELEEPLYVAKIAHRDSEVRRSREKTSELITELQNQGIHCEPLLGGWILIKTSDNKIRTLETDKHLITIRA